LVCLVRTFSLGLCVIVCVCVCAFCVLYDFVFWTPR
jgi:hypothetical protein